jgi:hypothetical protein
VRWYLWQRESAVSGVARSPTTWQSVFNTDRFTDSTNTHVAVMGMCLRYVERASGVDTDALWQEIATSSDSSQ